MHQDNFIFLIVMNFTNVFYAYRRHFSYFWTLALSRSSLRHNLRIPSSLQPSTISFVRFPRPCLLCLSIVFPFQSFWSIQIHSICPLPVSFLHSSFPHSLAVINSFASSLSCFCHRLHVFLVCALSSSISNACAAFFFFSLHRLLFCS